MAARLLMTLDACLVLTSNSPAIALTRAPFVMGLTVFSFMAFIEGGNILFRAGGHRNGRRTRKVARQVKMA